MFAGVLNGEVTLHLRLAENKAAQAPSVKAEEKVNASTVALLTPDSHRNFCIAAFQHLSALIAVL